jgi:hypothetical protein
VSVPFPGLSPRCLFLSFPPSQWLFLSFPPSQWLFPSPPPLGVSLCLRSLFFFPFFPLSVFLFVSLAFGGCFCLTPLRRLFLSPSPLVVVSVSIPFGSCFCLKCHGLPPLRRQFLSPSPSVVVSVSLPFGGSFCLKCHGLPPLRWLFLSPSPSAAVSSLSPSLSPPFGGLEGYGEEPAVAEGSFGIDGGGQWGQWVPLTPKARNTVCTHTFVHSSMMDV